MSTAQAVKNAITLKGSSTIIADYLSEYNIYFVIRAPHTTISSKNIISYPFFLHAHTEYGINSILFQRGIYPPENFQSNQQYGLTILMSTDEKIQQFISCVLSQAEGKPLTGLEHSYFGIL